MEFNRNQYLMAGLVIFLLGLQFRTVEAFTLNPEASKFLAARFPESAGPTMTPASWTGWTAAAAPSLRTIRPPRWLGYALMSVGAVLILHSLAMKKPGG